MGTQKNPLNERVLLRIQNIRKKLWVRKYLKFYAENVCLSKHVIYISLLSSANYLLITRQVTSDHHLIFNFLNTALKELGGTDKSPLGQKPTRTKAHWTISHWTKALCLIWQGGQKPTFLKKK